MRYDLKQLKRYEQTTIIEMLKNSGIDVGSIPQRALKLMDYALRKMEEYGGLENIEELTLKDPAKILLEY